MTLTQLRYFLSIAATGTMSAASRQLGIAQPALSLQLANLEAELGQTLFVRHGRGMTLTQSGALLRDRATDILRHVELAKEELSSDAQSPAGTVAVGMATASNMAFAVELLVGAQARFPRLKVQLVESMSGFLLEWVERGRIDIAIVYDVPTHPTLVVEHLGRESLFVIAHPGSALEGTSSVPFARLAELPLILPGRQHRLGQLIHRLAQSLKVPLDIAAEVDSTYAIKKLVGRGAAFSILSRHTIEDELARGELRAVAIESPEVTRSIDMVIYPQRKLDPSVIAIQRLLKETVHARLSAPSEENRLAADGHGG
jgi:LysR family nitrogen assimilation transcriptional regulator